MVGLPPAPRARYSFCNLFSGAYAPGFVTRVPLVKPMLRLVLPFNGRVKVPGRRFGDACRRLYDLRFVSGWKSGDRVSGPHSSHSNIRGEAALIHQVIPKAPEKRDATDSDKNR